MMRNDQIEKCREHVLVSLDAVGRLCAHDPVLRAVAERFRTLARRAIAHPTIEHFADVERCRDWFGQVLATWQALGIEQGFAAAGAPLP